MRLSEISNYFSLAIKIILIASIFNAIYMGLWHIMSANIFLLILLFLPQILKRSYEIKLPVEFEWILLLFVISTFFLRGIQIIIAPLLFGIAMGLVGFMILLILYSTNQIRKNLWLMTVFAFTFSISLGFILELLKFYLKKILGHQLSQDIYIFSMYTMTYVFFGAFISLAMGYLYLKGYKRILYKLVRKFMDVNPSIKQRKNEIDDILELIKEGEGERTEFKSTLRVNLYTKDIDRKIEYSVLKTISSFLNSKGGILLIGVSDRGEIIGIEKDRFDNEDKFTLHLINLIKEKIGKRYLNLIDIQTFKIKDKTILKLECLKSDKPVFLKNNSGEEEFYIRAGPSSTQIHGSELIEYIEKRFKKKN